MSIISSWLELLHNLLTTVGVGDPDLVIMLSPADHGWKDDGSCVSMLSCFLYELQSLEYSTSWCCWILIVDDPDGVSAEVSQSILFSSIGFVLGDLIPA